MTGPTRRRKLRPKRPRPRASRSPLQDLRDQANLVGGLMAMPNTAAHIRQAANAVEALHLTPKKFDRVAATATRIATKDLLSATAHMMKSPNQWVRKLAPMVEGAYLASLPSHLNPTGV
jgi:hypothetical protein